MTNDEDYSDPADYGIIGVLDCAVINCILLFPQACLLENETGVNTVVKTETRETLRPNRTRPVHNDPAVN